MKGFDGAAGGLGRHFAAEALAHVLRRAPRRPAGDGRRAAPGATDRDHELVVEARAMAALMATFVGDVGAADSLGPEAGPSADPPVDDFSRVLLLAARGQRGILTGELQAAEEHLGGAETLARRSGNGFLVALVLNMQATLAELRGDETATVDLLAESVQRSVEDGMGWTLGYALPALAAAAARGGEDPDWPPGWPARRPRSPARPRLSATFPRPGRAHTGQSRTCAPDCGDRAYASGLRRGSGPRPRRCRAPGARPSGTPDPGDVAPVLTSARGPQEEPGSARARWPAAAARSRLVGVLEDRTEHEGEMLARASWSLPCSPSAFHSAAVR